MRLRAVEVRDYRSIFLDDGGHALRLELARGATTLVGPNNCGKSNVLRAISLALDPHHPYDAAQDAPGPRRFAHPIITLTFAGDSGSAQDQGLLEAAGAYEQSVGVGSLLTRALAGEVVLQVAFVPGPDGVRRHESLLTGAEARSAQPEGSQQLLVEALARLRETVRFVLISSGETIASVLEGNFREILHSVVRERLERQFTEAEDARQQYVERLQDSLLRPLRDRLAADVGGMFPEIEAIGLAPDVASIDRMLSHVEVSLGDLVTTPLAGKGTGVRGGVLVAMLGYLARNATRSMVFAVEEPEAFLHPAAQEAVREHLEQVAGAPDVTLLVTTHSPFTVTRSARGRVYELAKDREGRTRVAASAQGDAEHAPLIGGLLREASLEWVLATTQGVPPGTEAVVLVEGVGDASSLRLAAELVGRPDLLAGLCVRPTGGTIAMVAKAVIARAACAPLPLLIVVDNDADGRSAREMLTGHNLAFTKQQVFTVAAAFEGHLWPQFPVEAEDLFAPELIQGFVDHHGPSIWTGCQVRPDGAMHYDLDQSAKEELDAWLQKEARPAHVERWIALLLLVRKRAGLSVPGEDAAAIVAAAPGTPLTAVPPLDGLVLVIPSALEHARWLESGALVLDGGAAVPDGVTHVAFYASGIQPGVPAIVADHPNLLFGDATVEQLRATGKDLDGRVATVVERALRTGAVVAGTSRRVLLLSPVDDPATLNLEQPVGNTKQIGGRPVAWTATQRVIPLRALATSPATTDELEGAIARLQPAEGAA